MFASLRPTEVCLGVRLSAAWVSIEKARSCDLLPLGFKAERLERDPWLTLSLMVST